MVCVCNMGMSRDLAQRVSLARVDNVDRHFRVQAARTAIYDSNHPVNGAAIKRLLDQDSLVPSTVSCLFLKCDCRCHLTLRMHSLKNYPCLALTCLICW